ncbi:hypothetical protein FNF29_02154 [Cafeteria roenbergensis]|uniref:ER membrane protein complex subunit 4 n=1 Tax=Cafeteria roenbergensis TaxID=33653 RepID=A0A5A8DUU5_CAFRO|nr:hypothetical protein FNF29_02154 [Cafeteria roenbergensis]KAA0163005.1 hypothetical protein FNF31_03060 [Cafeteria roenbergensis]KAA0169186.1 hypothetical protein FNF28_02311 [Cafeteria roenbergensis]|eukprot:KAA0155011.1 hypothetical protein FNF29_02154 [Cafeteria roenbergensis]
MPSTKRCCAGLAVKPDAEFASEALLPPGMAPQRELAAVVSSVAKKDATIAAVGDGDPLANYRKVASSIAWSPSRNLLMYMFMMWMTGSQLNVYTIFILQPLIMGPVTAIATMSKQFEVVADVGLNLTPFRLTYLFFVSLGFCLVAYKMYQLGLLPVTSADWITLLPQHVPPQRIWPAGGFI